MKNLLLGFAFLAAVGFTGSSFSATFNLTSPHDYFDLAGHSGMSLGSSFTHKDTVNLDTLSDVTFVAAELVNVSKFIVFELKNISETFSYGSATVFDSGTIATTHSAGLPASAKFSVANLAAGTYRLIISGDVSSTKDAGQASSKGSYSVTGEANPIVTPIPAAIWLFGSALVGLVGASRRKASALAA